VIEPLPCEMNAHCRLSPGHNRRVDPHSKGARIKRPSPTRCPGNYRWLRRWAIKRCDFFSTAAQRFIRHPAIAPVLPTSPTATARHTATGGLDAAPQRGLPWRSHRGPTRPERRVGALSDRLGPAVVAGRSRNKGGGWLWDSRGA